MESFNNLTILSTCFDLMEELAEQGYDVRMTYHPGVITLAVGDSMPYTVYLNNGIPDLVALRAYLVSSTPST